MTERRKALGLSRPGLAAAADVHRATVWRIEAGQLLPADEVKWRVAGALGVSVGDLWSWPPPMPEAVAS